MIMDVDDKCRTQDVTNDSNTLVVKGENLKIKLMSGPYMMRSANHEETVRRVRVRRRTNSYRVNERLRNSSVSLVGRDRPRAPYSTGKMSDHEAG